MSKVEEILKGIYFSSPPHRHPEKAVRQAKAQIYNAIADEVEGIAALDVASLDLWIIGSAEADMLEEAMKAQIQAIADHFRAKGAGG